MPVDSQLIVEGPPMRSGQAIPEVQTLSRAASRVTRHHDGFRFGGTRPFRSDVAGRAVELVSKNAIALMRPTKCRVSAFVRLRAVVIGLLFVSLFAGHAFAQQSDDFNSCVPAPAVWTFVFPSATGHEVHAPVYHQGAL